MDGATVECFLYVLGLVAAGLVAYFVEGDEKDDGERRGVFGGFGSFGGFGGGGCGGGGGGCGNGGGC